MNIFKTTKQIFIKLSRSLETAVTGAHPAAITGVHPACIQHKICKFQFIALTCIRWSKMAKIPRISATSGGENNPTERGKIIKFGRSVLLEN